MNGKDKNIPSISYSKTRDHNVPSNKDGNLFVKKVQIPSISDNDQLRRFSGIIRLKSTEIRQFETEEFVKVFLLSSRRENVKFEKKFFHFQNAHKINAKKKDYTSIKSNFKLLFLKIHSRKF